MTEEQRHGIRYVTGDATRPQDGGDGLVVVAHICNDAGRWGAGFTGAVSRRWSEPEEYYRAWHRGEMPEYEFKLGEVQFVVTGSGVVVANMIAQHGVGLSGGRKPIRYLELAQCLEALQDYSTYAGAGVHMPRIGTGLAGGSWEEIESLIRYYLIRHGVSVTVYDLAGS